MSFMHTSYGHPQTVRTPILRELVLCKEWIETPVPTLADPAVHKAAQAQLDENRSRHRGWF